MLPALEISRGLLHRAIERDLRIDILFVEMLVNEIARLEDDDDERAEDVSTSLSNFSTEPC